MILLSSSAGRLSVESHVNNPTFVFAVLLVACHVASPNLDFTTLELLVVLRRGKVRLRVRIQEQHVAQGVHEHRGVRSAAQNL